MDLYIRKLYLFINQNKRQRNESLQKDGFLGEVDWWNKHLGEAFQQEGILPDAGRQILKG